MKKLEQQKLLELMSDIDVQPDWRSIARKACAYYDGDQLPQELVNKLRDRGQPLTMHNLIAPCIDGVLGMEAKTRTDLVVIADDPDEEMEQLAEAVNAEFADVVRLSKLDRARSEAYAGQIKCGIGWVEVTRNSNPFEPNRYKIINVPRDEVFWDWHSKEPDLSDARWLMRRRWIDADELMSLIPSKAKIIEWSMRDWGGFVDVDHIEGVEPDLATAYHEAQLWTREQGEWMNQERNRVLLQVIYSRHYRRIQYIQSQDGQAIEFDKANMMHVAAVESGKVQLRVGQTSEIIETWYAGPHFLGERPCNAPQGMFPLVPFFGYRKDACGSPYGLVVRAIPAQDEVNFRRIKLTWLLQAKRVIMDKDATNMPRDRVMEEIERPDGLIELNPDRRNQKSMADSFRVEQDFNVASQQFSVMQDSMKLIQDGMGVYAAFLGQESGAESGVAIANLVEQGATTLSELNDNYRFACQAVGELILCHILEDLQGERNYPIVTNRDDKLKRKQVIINEETEQGLNNDVSKLRAHISLAPIQQTAAYKAQLAERMMQVTGQLPAEVQASVIDLVLELSDIPNKQEFMERVRGALGVQKDIEDMSEEEQAALQQQQQQQAEQEQMQMELAMREMAAKVAKLEGEAQKATATANSQKFDDAKTQAETAKILQEMQKLSGEVQMLEEQMVGMIEQQITAML